MAEIDNTTSGIVWQWLAEHKQDVLDYFSSIMREASDIQLVNFDETRHLGVLATYIYQGVRRVDNVKPSTLAEGLSHLTEDLIIRAENAAAEAERQGTYAKTQGDRAYDAVLDMTELKAAVKAQGDTAEAQGARAQQIYDTVNGWYSPFRSGAESWLSQSQAAWADWYPATQGAWNAWYAARVQQWLGWFTNGVVPDWNDFWAGVQQDWQDWTEAELARQQAELDRIDHEIARMAAERVREAAEQERQRQETVRQGNEAVREEQEAWRELAEGVRQQTFETNEAQRQQDFENAEADRMAAMVITRAFVDTATMALMFVQPATDSTEYKVNDGYLDITVRYEA